MLDSTDKDTKHKHERKDDSKDRLDVLSAPQNDTPAPEDQSSDARDQKIQEQHKKILQLMAEIDNLQRRHHKDLDRIRYVAIRNFALDMCTVLDNLDLALKSIQTQHHASQAVNNKQADSKHDESDMQWQNIWQGLMFVKQHTQNVLQKYNIKLVQSDNQPFDPHIHEAVQKIHHATCPDGHVCQTLRNGYTINDQILRPAQVVVSLGKEK